MARIPKEHEDAMIEAYLNGATQKQAAALFGYDKTTCGNVLKRHGLTARSRGIPKEHEDAMIAAYLAGATQDEAAALFGYDGTTCGKLLKRREIVRRTLSEVHQVPQEHQDAIVEMYLNGVSATQAAAAFGYSTGVCLNALKRHGIAPRDTDISKAVEDAIIEAYLNGATVEEAAALFGYYKLTCRNILLRRGIPTRRISEVRRLSAEARRVPKEHEDAIVAAYLEGATAKQAALFGYSNVTCLNILKRRDLIARSSGEARSVPREHADAMIEAYLNGATSTKAASIFGYSNATCINVLKQRGIMIRTRSEALRRNALDESFFDSIDTEDKAYWLGFLTADGCVRGGRSVDINLQIGDSVHLQKFAESLHSEHPVGFREVVSSNGTVCPQATIRISSIKLVAALNCLGLWPNKTFNVRPCEQVSEPFLAAYWRGIFDGDGWIYFNDLAKKPRYCIGWCSCQSAL